MRRGLAGPEEPGPRTTRNTVRPAPAPGSRMRTTSFLNDRRLAMTLATASGVRYMAQLPAPILRRYGAVPLSGHGPHYAAGASRTAGAGTGYSEVNVVILSRSFYPTGCDPHSYAAPRMSRERHISPRRPPAKLREPHFLFATIKSMTMPRPHSSGRETDPTIWICRRIGSGVRSRFVGERPTSAPSAPGAPLAGNHRSVPAHLAGRVEDSEGS